MDCNVVFKQLFEKTMIVSVHQDDEIISCGALISKLFANKCSLTVLSPALKVFDHKLDTQISDDYRARLDAAIRSIAAEHRGAFDLIFGNFETEVFYQKWRDVLTWISEQIYIYSPTTVLIPWRYDLHQDHRTVSEASRFSFRGLNVNSSIRLVLEYETPSSSEQQYDYAFCPNFFLPVTEEDVNCKIKGLQWFPKEIREYPHPRSAKGLVLHARYRGMACNSEFAEAFKIYRMMM